MPAGDPSLAARHHFVPGAGARDRAVGDQRKEGTADQIGLVDLGGGLGRLVRQQNRRVLRGIKFAAQISERAIPASPGAAVEQQPTLAQFERNVLAGFPLDEETPSPGGVMIGPGLDGVDVSSGFGRREAAAPAVVLVKLHRDARPAAVALRPPQEFGGEHRLAVAENVRPDLDRLAGDALDRKAASIDCWEYVFDDDPAASQATDR